MKKMLLNCGIRPRDQIFRKMKVTVFLLTISILGAFASGTYSQTTKLTLQFNNTALEKVLGEIENQSEFRFFYNENVNVRKEVTVTSQNKSVFEILDYILEGTGIKYRIIGRQIALYNQNENFNPTAISSSMQIQVQGRVTDSSGSPLPGVTVVVKNTTQGTITDANGNYSLFNVPGDATLVFSFVGMRIHEIAVVGKTTINVVMEEETIGIEEVIAIGYGTISKQALTGAVTKANLETFENVPVNNVLETIKGSVAGLNVGGINTAGAVAGLSIRGQNSTAASNTPLIVIDGAIFNGSLADLPTYDIENLTVLKDASAAAVYGSRSANGVIIIDTKRGEGIRGKPKFDVKMSYGISDQLKPLKVYDAEGYLQRLLDIRETNGQEANPDNIRSYLQAIELENYDATPDHKPTLTDPFDLISRLGYTFNTTVSVSNSTEKMNYYISTSLVKQQGVIVNDDFKHVSGRVNIDSDLTEWFNLGIKSFYSLRDYSGDAPSMYWATMFSPYASIYNEDGSYKQYPQSTNAVISPFWEIATEDTDIRNNLSGVITGIIKVPWVKGLTYQATYSNSVRWNENHQFYDEYTTTGDTKNGAGYREYNRDYNMLLDNMLKYNRIFADKHHVDVTLLFSREHSSWEDMEAYAEDFENTTLGSYALENGNIQQVETGGGETDAIGMMARGTYTYNHKYSITGTVRRDGYSAFSKNKKWGVFPSVGFNWNVSRESFIENIDAINNLALRASYGKNGNQSIDPYTTLAKVSTDKYIFYESGGTYTTVTQYISSLANNELGWESTTGLNLGIDFTLLDNRISGSVDAYKTKTNDLMFDLSIPATSGMSSITSNIGEIKNKGFELNLHTLNLDKGRFKWFSDFAFSLNRNKVTTILGEDNDGDGKEDDLISDGYFIGRSLGTIYAYKVTGMWQQEDEDNGTIMSGMRPGDYKLEDINRDGAITSDKDRQFIGNTNPNFRWSWTNALQYKDFSLMLYFYSIWGGDGWYLSSNNDPYNDGYVNNGAVNRPVYDYWTSTNTGAEFPRTDYKDNAAYKGTKYIDRSFVKLQKISLTYNATRLVKPWGINGLSCSLSADNLFTYAPHWEGLDPETDSGLSNSSLPSIRTYLFSISFNF